MKFQKRYTRVWLLSCSLLFAASCSINQNSSITDSSNEEISSSSSESSIEEESSTVDPNDPNKDLKTKLAYTYHDYGEHNIAGYKYMPSLGSPKMLVVPVWFTDSSSAISTSHKEDVRSDIEKVFFGTTSDTGWNSVHSYYETLSDGRLNIGGVVTDWWECGMSSSTAGSSQSSTVTLVENAVNWYFSKQDAESRESFDLDADGYLDAVVLVYGAADYASSRNYSYENLWAYTSWLLNDDSDEDKPTANAFLWASYDFMYGTSTSVSRTGHYYGGGDTSNCTIDGHTFIHESGHLLGLEDYYDYCQQYNPAGGFSMQDENVGSHDPYSAMALGWVDPIIPTESMTISLRPFQNKNHDLILLTNAWNGEDSPFDEYLLLEFYTPTGLNEMDANYTYNYSYPKGPTSIGIRLWHVDSRLVRGTVSSRGSVTWSSTPLTDPTINNCYLMQSNTSYNSNYPEYFQAYGNVLGTSYANYNFLQLIKNSETATYKTKYGTNFSASDLFGNGSSFTMSKCSNQFVNGEKLNCKDYLGWSFSVSIEGKGEDAIAKVTVNNIADA